MTAPVALNRSVVSLAARGRSRWIGVIVVVIVIAAIVGVVSGHAIALARVGAAVGHTPRVSDAQALAGPSAQRVFIPALSYARNAPDCQAVISAVNLGPSASKAILVLWSRPDWLTVGCEAPSEVLCSGLLRPGGAWEFEVKTAAGSGVLYSFTTQRLSEIGVNVGADDIVADYVCTRLDATVVGDCGAYSAFAAAYASGGTYFGVPMDRAAGSPLAAEAYRACPGDFTGGVMATSLYDGIGANALGSVDDAVGGYRYHAAPIQVDRQGFSSTLFVQNAGATETSVDVWFQRVGACDGGQKCRTVDIDPGASALIFAADCVGSVWVGSAWLRSTGPVALAVDTVGRDVLATFTGVPPAMVGGPTGALADSPESHAAAGPLSYDAANGWDTEVTVQNLSRSVDASVTVELRDAGGAITARQEGSVCRNGSATFVVPVTDNRPGERPGSLRVVSTPPVTDPASGPAPISAVVTLVKYNDEARSETTEALSYNLLPESSAVAWPGSGTVTGSPVVVVPTWTKDLDASNRTAELAISNLVAVPGWTDVAVLMYDQNALVDVYCRRLSAGQTTYLEPQIIGATSIGFRGSALVSATYWEHPTPPNGLGPPRQLVGLGAVTLLRTGTREGEDVPGDELAGATGIGLPAWPDPAAIPWDTCGTAQQPPMPPAAGSQWQSVVPVYADRVGLETELTIRNTGTEPTDVRLRFKALGDCLRERLGTVGPLAAGETATVSASAWVGPDWMGSVTLLSREPLSVSAESTGPGTPITVAGRPGRLPFDVNDDGHVDAADVTALEAARGTSPGGPGWNPHADLDANGVVNAVDAAMLEASLCGADRPPDTPSVDLPVRRADAVMLPVLGFTGNVATCSATIAATNIGAEPTKLLLVGWGAPAADGSCAGPLKVECSGLLRPGGSWTFAPSTLPIGAKSALVFSLSVRPLSELGASVGGDQPAADYLCLTLMQQLVGDCTAYARFKADFDAGAVYDGVPLGRAAGSAISTDVARICPGDLNPSIAVTAAYSGVGAHEVGALDPALGRFLTYAPLIYGHKAGFNTTVYIQNAGAAPATVAVWRQGQDDCSGGVLCRTLSVAPGETFSLLADVAGSSTRDVCAMVDWQGNIWLESDQPLAAIPEIRGRDVLFNYQAVAPDVAYDPNGVPLPAADRTVAYGPLPFSHDTLWDSGVQVQNLSRTRLAEVRVEFLDERGAPIQVLDDFICAAGSQTFFLPVQDDRPERRFGSVRVVSAHLDGDASVAPAPIAAVSMGLRYSDPARSVTQEAAAYNLLPERQALARAPGVAGGTTSGIGAVALSGLVKAGADNGASSELAVTNFVTAPGWTNVAISLWDANGVVGTRCLRVDAGATAYLDVANLNLPDDFRGSAIVSAVSWQHWVGGAGRGPLHNLVGLGAVTLTHRDQAAGDGLGMTAGVPLAHVPDPLADPGAGVCAAVPTITVTPEASGTPGHTATPSPTASMATPTRGTPAVDQRWPLYLPYANKG